MAEILAVLSKYGLAGWASRLGLTFGSNLLRNRQGQTLVDANHEERIRLAIEELGPAFIKLGQVLSTRPDQVGFALADELSNLQQNTPADSPDDVIQLVERELDCPIADVFATFDAHPHRLGVDRPGASRNADRRYAGGGEGSACRHSAADSRRPRNPLRPRATGRARARVAAVSPQCHHARTATDDAPRTRLRSRVTQPRAVRPAVRRRPPRQDSPGVSPSSRRVASSPWSG